jgi:hypothetical protein
MPSRLRPQQLEARVIELVDLVLAGGRIEDDLVECKGQWPDPRRRPSVRQLAGAANKARGEPILWIIGLDEGAQMLTEVRSVDVADWWPAISSHFDPPAPELEHHIVVPVGEGQAVTALRFLTDRSPYVILGGGEDGKLDREVPIRDGTRTRSARRDELLRLLIPAVAPPAAQLLSATLTVDYAPAKDDAPAHAPFLDTTSFQLHATIFFDQPAMSTGVVMLPKHLMHARIESTISRFRFPVWELHYSYPQDDARPAFGGTTDRTVVVNSPMHGVDRRHDGVVITGPGTLVVSFWERLDGELLSMLLGNAIQVHLSLGVAGLDRRIRLDAELDCLPGEPGKHRSQWQLNEPADDPWAETKE